jgi:hypothetical protein
VAGDEPKAVEGGSTVGGETASPLLEEIHERIVEQGESLDRVEDELINPASGLSTDQRAALWLYAWSLQSPAHQRYEARNFLSQLESAERSG